jgi:hypothetical protein
MRAWVTSGVRACTLLVVCGCGPSAVDVGIEMEGAASESDVSESGLLAPDLPPEPECPAGLGEVVVCECAVVDGCSIPDVEPDNGCAYNCVIPSPCPPVTCTGYPYDFGSVTCEDELDVAALQCVFDALAEGQPMGWRTTLYGTHQFFQEDTWNEYRRLDATTYARFAGHYWFGHSPPSGHTEGSFDAFELPESEWMDCEALADDYHRFMCLHRLAAYGEPCADPALLVCP